MEKNTHLFENTIINIVDLIKEKKFDQALSTMGKDGLMDSHPSIANNLMGTIHELQGDIDRACDFYRASLIFDGAYKPADNNLANITRFDYSLYIQNIDFGLINETNEHVQKSNDFADENEYYIDFSKNNVGKLRRRD